MEISNNVVLASLDKALDTILKHKKQVALTLGFIVLTISVLVGYTIYRNRLQVNAHKAFLTALKVYEAPIVSGSSSKTEAGRQPTQFPTEEEKWKYVQKLFHDTYKEHKGAGIAPFFLAYQAEALVRLGKFEESINTLTESIRLMASEELKSFYRVKLALIKLDSPAAGHQQEGFASLKKLADDQQGLAHESALYHLGNYFWSKKDFVQAKNYWQQLMIKYGLKDGKQSSGYADLVKPKLRLISADF